MTERPGDQAGAASGAAASSDAGAFEGAEYDPCAFPPFAVTVDLALLTVRSARLEVVLVRRREAPYAGRWSLPGGFVRPDEPLHEAVRRVFTTKTGLAVPYVEQLATYGEVDRDPRMRVVSVAYLVLLPVGVIPEPDSEAGDARFFPVDQLPAPVEGRALAFDHDRILADAVDRARSKLEYTTLAARLLPEEFTLADLRRVYEAVWGEPLHHANFTRKVRSVAGFVVPTGRRLSSRGGAELFGRGPAELMMPPLMRRGPGE
jgi:8-oxo-dGTP diphosphatase